MPKDLYSDLIDEPSAVVDDRIVPNVQPKITNVPYKLAIVGEAPGADEVSQGSPFVGYSGQILDRFLSRFGILRDACFIGNVCRQRPSGNKIATFDWSGPEIQNGLAKLGEDLKTFRPNVVLLLGGSALHAFMSPDVVPKKHKSKEGLTFAFPNSISNWHGSFFESHSLAPLPFVKCIASYHPAACLRQYEWTPRLMLDIKRAFDDATFPELSLPKRQLLVDLSFEETIAEMRKVIDGKQTVGTDIEGYWNNWSCISFASRPDYCFIVPLTKMDGTSYWSLDEEVEIIRHIALILSDPKITKVWQNGLYDRFCTQYGYRIVTRGPSHDIMLKHWELYCELPKGLDDQAAIYTRQPYYKTDRGSEDRRTFWEYCCTDSAVTKEIDEVLDRYLHPESRRHYEFNLSLLNALLYMELRGIRYDTKAASRRLTKINTQIYELQHDLNLIAGVGVTTTDKVLLRAQLRDHLCHKRDPSKVKKGNEADFDLNMRTLLGDGPLTKAELGRLEICLDRHLNTKGAALKTYLYETLKLPVQRHPKTKEVTTDYDALIALRKKSDHPSLPLVISIGELRTRSQMLGIHADPDQRVRAGYNVVGGETGRITCYTSPTGSGYNLTTIPDENEIKPEGDPLREGMRDLLIADEGCYLAKCDLKGADGWSIGANLAALGDPTMLDDLRFGLKPAHFPCYERRHGKGSTSHKSREELREMFKEIKKSDWDYFAAKQCTWGFFYLMGIRKAVAHIFHVSEGTVLMSEAEMADFKDALMRRYNGPLWWRAMENTLFKQQYPPKLSSPSGHTRLFFDRKTEILGQALAHEPQSVTTYATNTAVTRCWSDPENRERTDKRSGMLGQSGPTQTNLNRMEVGCRLKVEPLHQVHDEALFQFRIEDTPWAITKIRQWFANPVRIAGIEVTIPFEGSYGTNWAMNDESKKGTI